MSAETAEVCQFHGYHLDLVRRQLLDPQGAPVPLMPKATETLVHLVTHAGQTVTKEELLRAVWPSSPNEVVQSDPQSIAILPFKPVVEEHRNEAMELGMADSLIMELSRSEHLIVRPLSATRRFVAVDHDPLKAGRTLEVEAVVDGAIQIVGDRIRASARLLRVADGRQLWAGKFDEAFSSTFQVQDAIAQRVAEALEISLNPRSPRQTENLRAYELYMRGRVHALRLVMPELRRGIEYFERAIAEDPSCWQSR